MGVGRSPRAPPLDPPLGLYPQAIERSLNNHCPALGPFQNLDTCVDTTLLSDIQVLEHVLQRANRNCLSETKESISSGMSALP